MISYANFFGKLASGKQFANATLDGCAFSFTNIPIEDLATGVSITSRAIAVVPAGYCMVIDAVHLIPTVSGTDTTITTAATSVFTVKSTAGTIVTKTYASTGSFVVGSLGTVQSKYQILDEGKVLYLDITNAATVNLPGFFLQISGTLSKIK